MSGLEDSAQLPASGVVLAGGQSRRLGRDKRLEPVGGQPLIRRVIGRVEPVVDEIVVVVADPATGESLPLEGRHRRAQDRYPGKGSLGGIFSGVSAARQQWSVVVACDMPFLNLDLLRHMLSLREGVDAVVPVLDGRPEPTHALYSKECLPHIEERLKADDLKISRFYDQVRVEYVSEGDILKLDPDLLSFFNVNSPTDLEQALELVQQGR